MALIAAVVALSAGILYVGIRGFGVVVGGVGSSLSGFVQSVTATATPTPIVDAIADAPTLDAPAEAYTSQPTVDLIVTVPASLVGDKTHKIRLYLALPDQQPAAIKDVPIASTPKTVIPGIELTDGVNDFSVTIVGPAGESGHSLPVRYIFDNVPPKITITSPKNNALVNGQAVTITGKTQARTTLTARNDADGSSVTGTAGTDGTFSLSVAIAAGSNKITISATDPAGNAATSTLTVRRGTGKLTVSLTASTYQIKRSSLPQSVTLFATVTDPNGQALAGAAVTFTLSMPGIPTISIDGTTASNGKASFKTSVPKGAAIGQGSATVLVTTTDFGSTEDYTVISIVK